MLTSFPLLSLKEYERNQIRESRKNLKKQNKLAKKNYGNVTANEKPASSFLRASAVPFVPQVIAPSSILQAAAAPFIQPTQTIVPSSPLFAAGEAFFPSAPAITTSHVDTQVIVPSSPLSAAAKPFLPPAPANTTNYLDIEPVTQPSELDHPLTPETASIPPPSPYSVHLLGNSLLAEINCFEEDIPELDIGSV